MFFFNKFVCFFVLNKVIVIDTIYRSDVFECDVSNVGFWICLKIVFTPVELGNYCKPTGWMV